jgi:holo-[acyl-carrier protein] synthase
MIGIDLIKTSRMESLLNRFGEKGLHRFLDESEILLIKNYKTAAGFWAIKEAFSKAIGTGIGASCSFYDIRIYKDEKGAPHIAVAKHLVEQFKILKSSISLTHDGEYAIAVVHLETDLSSANKIKQF